MGNSSEPMTNYNVPITELGNGESAIYRNANYKNELILSPKEGILTIHDGYKHMFSNYKNLPMLGERKIKNNVMNEFYSWKTFGEVQDLAEKLATNIIKKDLAPVKEEFLNYKLKFVGIYAKNSMNWGLTDIACTMQGITSIPIYDTLGEEATKFAFNQTNMTTLFLTSSHFIKIFKMIEEGLGDLKNLVIMDEENFTSDMKNMKNDKIQVLFFNDLLVCDEKIEWAEITPESIYTFSYTSGTTGEPKGAMISHRNIISLIAACKSQLPLKEKEEVYLSYLPLAHVMERAISNFLFYFGAKYGYFNGNVLKLKDDLAILKPTVFASVPRLFTKFYQTIKEKFSLLKGFKLKLLNKGLKKKLKNLENGCYTHKIYDKLIFNKVKNVLGGNVKIMLTGSAPIDPEILNFLKVSFCAPIIEGYGQTEGLAAEFLTKWNDGPAGHVGGIYPHLEFKLVDIPEMSYLSTDKDSKGRNAPRGEIWVRGNSIIPGYYKNEAKNKETFTNDGWMLSGDIGLIEAKFNRVKIIDRKKNIFKLSQGEYIAPEKLENAYKIFQFLNDIYVYGDSLKSCLVAILNIDRSNMKQICKQINIEFVEENLNEIKKSKEVVDYLTKSLLNIHKNNKFNSLERIKKFYIETIPFQELDLITTSFKVKRNETKEHYKEILDELYKDLQ